MCQEDAESHLQEPDLFSIIVMSRSKGRHFMGKFIKWTIIIAVVVVSVYSLYHMVKSRTCCEEK